MKTIRAFCLPLWLSLLISSGSYAQTSFSNNPDSSIFLTKDIDHFWTAFDLLSGVNTNQKSVDYGNNNKEKLCREFLTKMDSTDYMDWLYGVSGKDGRPNDLGYWMGYKITEQYFKNSIDKQQAVREILDIKDYKAFLIKSGFLKEYMGQAPLGKLDISHLTGDFYIYTTYGMYKGTPVPANGMYLVTSRGVVMFDTPWDKTQFQPLLDSIMIRHHKKVVICIATHFHGDRTNGLEYYSKAGIRTYTTKQTDDSSRARNEKRAEYLIYKDTVFRTGQYSFQTYYAGPGHTADNIVIWFEKEKILYGGCLVKSIEATDLGNLGDANVKDGAQPSGGYNPDVKARNILYPGMMPGTAGTR